MDEHFRRRLAEVIIQIRGDLSQRDFAETLGISYSTVQAWESKRNLPSLENLEKIAEFRNQLPEELLADLYGRRHYSEIPLDERLKIMSYDDLIDLLDRLAALLKSKR